MTRQEAYIAELSQLLFYMTPWDKAAALKNVNKRFAEAANEAELIDELGTPMKLAVTLHRSYEATPEPTAEELAAREAEEAAEAAVQTAEFAEKLVELTEETESAEEAEGAEEAPAEENAEAAEESEAEIAEAVEEVVEEMTEPAEETVEDVRESAEDKAESVVDSVEEQLEAIIEPVEERMETAVDAAETKLEAAEEAVEAAFERAEEAVEQALEAMEEKLDTIADAIENAVEELFDSEEAAEEQAEEAEEAAARTPWVIEEKPEKEQIFAEIFNAATEAQSAVVIEEPKKQTRRKARYLLLIPYMIFAILVGVPGTIVFAAANLAVVCGAVISLVAMVYLVIFHLFAAVDLGSKLILLGLSLVMLALTVILAVFALWFLHNATLGFPRFLREVAMKHCYREVEVK